MSVVTSAKLLLGCGVLRDIGGVAAASPASSSGNVNDKECNVGSDGACATSPAGAKSAGLSVDQAMFQHGLLSSKLARGCTGRDEDPGRTGVKLECCAGLEAELGQWSGGPVWSFLCKPSVDAPDRCTGEGADPWSTGSLIECCDGLERQLGQWSGADRNFRCHGHGSQPAPIPPVVVPTPAATGGGTAVTFLQWNVHYSNHNYNGIADIVSKSEPDIVGLCEFTADPNGMAGALSHAMGRRYEVQPGRNFWVGYGTDIFFDATRFEALEGGVVPVHHCGSLGGPRGANWVVLEEKQTGKKLISGGLHTSYCARGCDHIHECELGILYDQFENAKSRHGQDAAVVWMGDLNRNYHTLIFQNLLRGALGPRGVFRVDDLAQTQGNTYYSGGSAIDFILGESGPFQRTAGGRTGQGTMGSHLIGADHFPIYAAVEWS